MPARYAAELPQDTLSLIVESIGLFLPRERGKVRIIAVVDEHTRTLIGAVGFKDAVPVAVEDHRASAIVGAALTMAGGAKQLGSPVSSIVAQYEGQNLVVVLQPQFFVAVLLDD